MAAAEAVVERRALDMIPKKPVPDLIREGNGFPAFAKPASAGEGRSDKIMFRQEIYSGVSPSPLDKIADSSRSSSRSSRRRDSSVILPCRSMS